MTTLTVTVPDNWPKHKSWNSATLMNCDKCEFHTPDVATYIRHAQHHILQEDQPETLTVAP